MSIFLLVLVITINFILGLLVLLRNKQSINNRFFFAYIITLVGWMGVNSLPEYAGTYSSALVWMKMIFIFGSFIPVFLFYFVLSFPSNNPLSKGQKLLIVIPVIISSLTLGGFVVSGVKSLQIRPIEPIFGSLAWVYVLHFIFFTFASLFIITKKFIKSSSLRRVQLSYIIAGFFVAILFGTITNLVLPLLGRNELVIVGPFSSTITVAFTAYAIVKHRLLDIRLLVLKSVAYTLSLSLLVAGYITLTVFIFSGLQSAVNPIILNIITLLALVFTFNPLRTFIENHTDRIFSKGRYNFNELLATIGDITKKNSRSISGLTSKVMETLTKEMRIGKVAFILTNSPTPHSIRTLGFSSRSKSLWAKPTKLVVETGNTIVYDELEEDLFEKEILRKIDAQVLIPIKTEQTTEAILALGEKTSGDMYTAQDLNLLELVAPQIAIALENAKSFKEKEQRIVELKSINKMFHHIEHFLDLDKLLQEIVDEAIKVTGAEGGSLMLLEKGGHTLIIKTAQNLKPEISLNAKIKIGEGLAGTVAKTREPLILNGFREKRFMQHLKREDIVSAISVPMMADDKLVGVLNVNRKKNRVEFTNENLSVMVAFASQAAEAIIKAGYYNRIEKLSIKNDNQFKEFTSALAKTVDAKDGYTFGHSEAVTKYAVEIAKEMGFDEKQLRVLQIGGRLHDIGKIGIPEHILNKPGGLADDEFEIIKRHPEIGARILRDTTSLKGIRDLILYHHERYDGCGYPTGLKGKEIPIGARILAVADAYDAMTSSRAYRGALPKKVAVTQVKEGSGKQFDPVVVKTFLRVLEKKRFRIIKNTTKQRAYVAQAKIIQLPNQETN